MVSRRAAADMAGLAPPPPSMFSSGAGGGGGGMTAARRALELELVNRWSVRTWKGLQQIAGCAPYLCNVLPREMLQYDFMLNCILALSAVDIALSGGGGAAAAGRYVRAALEYSTLASAQFRAAMAGAGRGIGGVDWTESLQRRQAVGGKKKRSGGGAITKENIHVFAGFAEMMGYFHFALPSSPSTDAGAAPNDTTALPTSYIHAIRPTPAISRVHAAMVMWNGSTHMAAINWSWYLAAPTSAAEIAANYSPWAGAIVLIDVETQNQIERISNVAGAVRAPASTGKDSWAEVESYRYAIGQVKYEFWEEMLDRMKAPYLSMPSISGAGGPEFIDGLRAREPLALFIVMYWGVLVCHSGAAKWDRELWWIGSTAKELIDEVSDLLMVSEIWYLEDVRGGVAWCRREAGLPPLGAVG